MPHARTPVDVICADCGALFVSNRRREYLRAWNQNPIRCAPCGRAHASACRRGRPGTPGFAGRQHSPEAKEKMRVALLRHFEANGHPNKGRTRSEEALAKQRASYVRRAGRPPLTREERRIVYNMQQLPRVRAYRQTPVGQMRNRIGSVLRNSLNKMGTAYKSRGAFRYLGYSAEDLANYIAARMYHHGFHCPMCDVSLGDGFDIDHVIPIRTAETPDDVIRLFQLSNLDVLCPTCNRVRKRGKLPQELAA